MSDRESPFLQTENPAPKTESPALRTQCPGPRAENPAPETESPALRTALAYYQAWTSHDFELAMTYVADDIVCHAPAGQLEGAGAFRAFMGPFTRILTASHLVAAFGDEETALLMYETDTLPVRDAPGAECLTVRDGKIRHQRIIFDRLPFELARHATAGSAAREHVSNDG